MLHIGQELRLTTGLPAVAKCYRCSFAGLIYKCNPIEQTETEYYRNTVIKQRQAFVKPEAVHQQQRRFTRKIDPESDAEYGEVPGHRDGKPQYEGQRKEQSQ